MKLLYFNDLRNLPNYGCRTTGAALEEMLRANNSVTRRDGLETVGRLAWESYTARPLRIGRLPFGKAYNFFWRNRYSNASLFSRIKRIDSFFGALHDFVSEDPQESLIRFKKFVDVDKESAELLLQVRLHDAIVINGEGTLIFGTPMKRDALFLLFLISLAREEQKPVYFLNSMITECPYTESNRSILKVAEELLNYCKLIVCRDHESVKFVRSLLGHVNNTVFIPDALFSWGDKIRSASSAVANEPSICIPFRSELSYSELEFKTPYICISASSSAWRYGEQISERIANLALELRKLGYKIYFLEACAGDVCLRQAGKISGIQVIEKETPVLAAAGILAGAQVYITGRYHPAIMASAGGVPCVFLSSNSHKTRSLQALLDYEHQIEFSIFPDDREIKNIVAHTKETISKSKLFKKRLIKRCRELETLSTAYKQLIS